MKAHCTALLTGLGGSLLLGGAAAASFTGLVTEEKDAWDTTGWVNPNLQLIVCNIYMQFDDPLDVGYALAGTPNNPLDISIAGNGTFYENPFGTERRPNAAFIPIFPSLEFDSFLTINTRNSSEGAPPSLSPGFPQGPQALLNGLSGTNLGWFVAPDDPLAVPDASGRVLIAQLSFDAVTSPNARAIQGTVLVQWDDPNGNSSQTAASFYHYVLPGPGTLGLLGLAGLGRGRRRRR